MIAFRTLYVKRQYRPVGPAGAKTGQPALPRAVLSATIDAGFPPWRLGIEGMPLLKQHGIDMALARRLKAWIDPDAVLAPGRYVWSPAD